NHPGKSWFFVRYLDPDPHLRLRIHRRGGWGKGRTEALIATLSECERNGEIARFEIRPYQPEFLRYPPPLLNEIESLFCASSLYIARLWDQPGPLSAFALHSPQTIWPAIDAICRGLGLPLQARKVQFEGLFKSILASHQ